MLIHIIKFIYIDVYRFSKLKILSFFRKDVRLPVHLQRAMAAEAEAAREARAKVGYLVQLGRHGLR